mgnify:CR=1 FL=1
MSPYRLQKEMDRNVYEDFMRPEKTTKQSQKRLRLLKQKVCDLPSQELAVVYLKFWEGLSDEAIAKKLALATIAVRFYLNQGLLRLKTLIPRSV